MFSLEEVGKCFSENRLLVQNLTAVFRYDVSRALNTMSIYKLRGCYLLLEEKDRKLFRNPGLLTALCPAVPLAGAPDESGSCALQGVPQQLCQPALGGLWSQRT